MKNVHPPCLGPGSSNLSLILSSFLLVWVSACHQRSVSGEFGQLRHVVLMERSASDYSVFSCYGAGAGLVSDRQAGENIRIQEQKQNFVFTV